MITPGEIQRIANACKVRDRQIEKDYVISWILWGLSCHSLLFENLLFKGGTVLKKAYFPDYRFSEDLDFTLQDDTLPNETLLAEFDAIFELLREEANLTLKRGKQHEHAGSESINFHIAYIGPLGGKIGSRDLKIDVTRQEILEFSPLEKTMFAEYSDLKSLRFSIRCYQLAEILIEKMAALMGRTIPRDLYDLWYLLTYEHIDIRDYYPEFERKAWHKGHNPKSFVQKLFAKEPILKRDWNTNLRSQVHDLPEFDNVMRELKKHLRKL